MNNISKQILRIGHGYDVHALGEGLKLVLGGVELSHSKGCIAHSDGDVVIHAMCDAILGSLALGDIGKHFPDTDPQFKGIDSKVLLRNVVSLAYGKGYVVSNIDVTIALQAPKIGRYIETMRTVLADVMSIDMADISIKATTTERLGFVGREEGVAADCVVLMQRM